jgi:hypothetical protein
MISDTVLHAARDQERYLAEAATRLANGLELALEALFALESFVSDEQLVADRYQVEELVLGAWVACDRFAEHARHEPQGGEAA